MFTGTLGRAAYFFRMLSAHVLMWVLVIVSAPGLPTDESGRPVGSGDAVLAVAPLVLTVLLILNFQWRRLQDTGVHGAWSLAYLAVALLLGVAGFIDALAVLSTVYSFGLLLLPTGALLRFRRRRREPAVVSSAHFGQGRYFGDDGAMLADDSRHLR